jgi:hypothetical protein
MPDEEEITRCICGQDEYPGPPSDTGKSRDAQLSSITDSDIVNDEAGGLYIQCDMCKVWQHGGCVGIMEEATTPDEYFCEECRKDLHKVMTSTKGQKYSRYLPVYDQQHAKNARKGSVSKDGEIKPKDKDRNARASVDSFSKRRSTMNSRAAYEEDEMLRKVLEESKHEGPIIAGSNSGNRKKRSRDESEETKPETKRQRTSSRSASNSPVIESEEELDKNNMNSKQKPRGAAARSQREKELRDKERERERAEAANRRKGRFERRRGEDAELAEQKPADDPPVTASASESVAPETPTADLKPPPVQRKSGRPPQKRQGRLGRNQYSRDGPVPNGASPGLNHDTPNSPQISATNGVGNDSSDGAGGHKSGKSKNWRLEKLSWNEIRRPAGAMQNYITQRQVELAGEKNTPAPPVQTPETNGEPEKKDPVEDDDLDSFKHLSTLQMMDDLSRDLVHWQRLIADHLEK